MQRLELSFIDERFHLGPGDAITFGRTADIVLDANPWLHRICGRVVWREGLFWLQNLGARLPLVYLAPSSALTWTIPPGCQVALTVAEFSLELTAGRAHYRIEATLDGVDASTDEIDMRGTVTLRHGLVPLTADQHLLLVALCEMTLRHPAQAVQPLPRNDLLATRLGWTMGKFNRKLDSTCAKFVARGVRGLQGSNSGRANDRRRALIDHAISNGLVTPSELALLPQGDSATKVTDRSEVPPPERVDLLARTDMRRR